MSGRAVEMRKGTRLVYEVDGEKKQGVVISFLDSGGVVLRHRDQSLSQHDLGVLLSTEGTVVFDEGHAPVEEYGTGILLQSLSTATLKELERKEAHVLEVLYGYPFHIDPEDPPAQPPREPYRDDKIHAREKAKAIELGVHWQTVRNWHTAYEQSGLEGLLDKRGRMGVAPLDNVDARWVDAARAVILGVAENESRISIKQMLKRVEAKVSSDYPDGDVVIPPEWTARRALKELDRGVNALGGQSMKNVRSNLNRPVGVYGRLRAHRPGEIVLLDTTRLDVHALERFTNKWVPVELSVALDLFDRVPVGLACRAFSTKTSDVFDVSYEACSPSGSAESLWSGIPGAFVVDADRATFRADGRRPTLHPNSVLGGQRLLPEPAPPENFVVDRGKVFVSEATRRMCRDLGISLWPCRAYTPTDKAVVERFFRTLREGLVEWMDGYTGPDVYSRGVDAEGKAIYFVDEIEVMIRSWIRDVYMDTPHQGIALPDAPGVQLTPREALRIGQAIRGRIRVPATPQVLLGFLPIHWRTIQHYGVEIDGLYYNGPALDDFRNVKSGQSGRKGVRGKYAFRRDPRDVRRIWFENPDKPGTWHALWWKAAERYRQPFSAEVVCMAKQIMRRDDRFPNVETALAHLLEKFKKQTKLTPTERRVALQRQIHLDEIDGLIANPDDEATIEAVSSAEISGTAADHGVVASTPGEVIEDLDNDYELEDDEFLSDDDFYSDRMEVA